MPTHKFGPFVLPWQSTDEFLLVLLCGVVGAVLGATVLTHYRRRKP